MTFELPAGRSLGDIFEDMPPLEPELIHGLLRVGHKMLVASESKAGKTFLLQELAVCMAEGLPWMGFDMSRGKCLYLNFELAGPSFDHRFQSVYDAIAPERKHVSDVTVLNLRGMAPRMEELATSIIGRYADAGLAAIIFDPIYKSFGGDENSASDTAEYMGWIDRVAEGCKCSIVYCHHFSKGASGKYRNAADRASGSGVFSRDPDAIVTLTNETPGEDERIAWYERHHDEPNADAALRLTKWQVDFSVREFATPQPIHVWFDYPRHVLDESRSKPEFHSDNANADNLSRAGKKSRNLAVVESYRAIREKSGESQGVMDTAVSQESIAEAVGISPGSVRSIVKKSRELAPATLDVDGVGVAVAIPREGNGEFTCVFQGVTYSKLRVDGKAFADRRWHPTSVAKAMSLD